MKIKNFMKKTIMHDDDGDNEDNNNNILIKLYRRVMIICGAIAMNVFNERVSGTK